TGVQTCALPISGRDPDRAGRPGAGPGDLRRRADVAGLQPGRRIARVERTAVSLSVHAAPVLKTRGLAAPPQLRSAYAFIPGALAVSIRSSRSSSGRRVLCSCASDPDCVADGDICRRTADTAPGWQPARARET